MMATHANNHVKNLHGPRGLQRAQGPHGHPGPVRLQGPGGPPGIRGPAPMRPQGPAGMRPVVGGSGGMPAQRPPVRPQAPPASNVTNNPSNAHSRIFVGNLNTMLIKKEDMEQIFRRYGIVSGISMHKGYAFVQYSRPDEARRAAISEDGKTYACQKLDINIASEPKKTSNKRPAPVAKFDAGSSEKKSRVEGSGGRQLVTVEAGGDMAGTKLHASATSITLARPTGKALKKTTISTGNDILVCGTCKSLYHSLATFVQHKKQKCELKTVCRCQQLDNNGKIRDDEGVHEPMHLLLCAVCDTQFATAWELCQHCQDKHSIAIFKEQPPEVNGDN